MELYHVLQEVLLQSSEREKQIVVEQLQSRSKVRNCNWKGQVTTSCTTGDHCP